MLDTSGLNYLAILVAWFVNIIIGAFWYSPAGFARQWARLTKIDIMKLPQQEATRALAFVAVSALIQAYALAIILRSLGATTAGEGLTAGLVLWLGFTAATTVGTTFYSRRSWGFWWLNSSYFLIVMLINSILLTIW